MAAIGAALALTGCAGARLVNFEATLAADPSATAALGTWCARRWTGG